MIGCEAAALLVYAAGTVLLPPAAHVGYAFPLLPVLGLAMGAAGRGRLPHGHARRHHHGDHRHDDDPFQRPDEIDQPRPRSASALRPADSLALQAGVLVLYASGAAIAGALNLYARPWAGCFPAAMVILVVAARLLRRV